MEDVLEEVRLERIPFDGFVPSSVVRLKRIPFDGFAPYSNDAMIIDSVSM